MQVWGREAEDHGPRRLAGDERDLDNKASGNWLDSHGRARRLHRQLGADTRVVSARDREGDLFELPAAARHTEPPTS